MIEIKNLSYSYEDGPVLYGINLDIKEGDFIAIIGCNGSGKTTLIKHLNGLLLPTSGTIKIDGIDTKTNSIEIKRKVGMVFQNPEDQLVYSVVEEDIAFGLENLGIPSEEIQKRVKSILKKLKIEYLEKYNVNSLSFGQKQLVALAGVLVMQPKYIVFDEPTSMLDPKIKSEIISIMKELNKQGITIILVTNNLEDIKNAKKAIAIKQGRILFYEKKDKLSKTIFKKAGICAG